MSRDSRENFKKFLLKCAAPAEKVTTRTADSNRAKPQSS
jgi:hypothetical protein